MRASAVLSLVAGVQVVFLLLVVGLLIVSRRRVTRMDRQHQRVALQLEEPLRAWAIGERSTESLLPLLRNMPPVVALESFAVHSAACVSRAERETMARMLRREEWVHKLLALHTSRRWTRRLRAARTQNQ